LPFDSKWIDRIVSIEGNFDEALEIVKEIAKSGEIELVNSVNPFNIRCFTV
jgi:threonine synthase